MINNKSFCILPWISAHLEASGSVKPCSMSADNFEVGNLRLNSLESIMNSEKYKELRQSFLKGETPEACRKCYCLEEVGQKTLRTSSNEKYKNIIQEKIDSTLKDGYLTDPAVLSLDIRFSNLCNFKCRTCNEGASSSWYQDANALRGKNDFVEIMRPIEDKDEMWKFVDGVIPSLKDIYVLGGEPLIDPDHYTFLDKLIYHNKTDIELRYSTNLSHLSLGTKFILDYWKKFKSVNLSLSYDGVGKQGEFIRKGMNWEKIVQNHKLLQQSSENLSFIITPTVSVLNAFHIIELIRFLLKEKMIDRGEQLGLNILDGPSYYNIKILNKKEKEALSKIYEEFIENELKPSSLINVEFIIEQLERVLKYGQQELVDHNIELERKKFLVHTSQLNKLRRENLLLLFPELSDFYSEVKS